jgi:hypothetical protein
MLSVHLKISGHYPDGRSAWLKMGLPDGYGVGEFSLEKQLASLRHLFPAENSPTPP